MPRAVPLLVTVVAVASVGGGAYALGEHEGSAGSGAAGAGIVGAVNPDGDKVKLRTENPAPGQSRIELTVVTTKGRNTVAMVPVFINGKGPLAFMVDTGASSTVIDERAARKVGLDIGRSIGTLQGVAGSAEGHEVSVTSWEAGDVKLKPARIAALKGLGRNDGPEGLLGSDVLSRYGKVALDYDNDVLLLDPKVETK